MSRNYEIMTSDPHRIHNYFKAVSDEVLYIKITINISHFLMLFSSSFLQGFKLLAVPFWKYLPAPSRVSFALKRLKFYRFLEKEIRERIAQRQQVTFLSLLLLLLLLFTLVFLNSPFFSPSNHSNYLISPAPRNANGRYVRYAH